MPKARGFRTKASVPGLSQVQGIGAGLSAPSPLTLPSNYLKSMGPAGPSEAQSVAKTGTMATAAAKAPGAPKAPKGGIRKIRVRKKRIRFVPAAPSGGFTLPAEPQY